MIALQVLSKVIASKDISFLEDNILTVDYFVGFEDEYNFIIDHYKKYGNVPDKATFLSHFSDENGNPTIELVEVTESDQYLLDTIREEYLYQKSVPILYNIRDLLKEDANAAAEYMIHAVRDLEPDYHISGLDIVSQANQRYQEFLERKNNQDKWFFTTGFQELDDITHGLQKGEEFVVIVARINQGKSWVLEKICSHIWQIGFNVGYISPEMGATNIGYRFDTLYNHFSNKDLVWGNDSLDEKAYLEYIEKLSKMENKFVVATPIDFQRKITVTKLRNWIKHNKLDMIAIDGITYLTDERFKRGNTKAETLTNIGEDLMSLSMELNIPVVVVVQANRGAVNHDDEEATPELETIKDSDGIAANASQVIAIKQMKNSVLRLEIKKQRNGKVGGRLDYAWDIDKGDFVFIPSEGDAESKEKTEEKVEELKKQYRRRDKKEAF